MKPIHLSLLALLLAGAVTACGAVARGDLKSPTRSIPVGSGTPEPGGSGAVPTGAVSPTVAPTVTPTWTPSPSPTPTLTLTPALPTETLPPFLASTPGIAATLTAVYSTPGYRETQAVAQTQEAATQSVLMGGFSVSLLSQCPKPSDPPMQDWVGIPVMPQATGGQVVQTLIGSYYCFRAPVQVQDVEAFYQAKLTGPTWYMQSDLNGSMTFLGFSPAGFQTLFIVSGPGAQGDLVVALNVTVPVSLPTPTK
jgi:hypothetical protein